MNAKTSEESNSFLRVKQSDGKNEDLLSKLKGKGSLSSKERMVRADTIDLKSLDIQLEQKLNRVWGKGFDINRPREEWEIDLSKLELKHLVAHGTYGSVYRGTYDDQDVAGTCLFLLVLAKTFFLLSCNLSSLRLKLFEVS